MESTGVVSREGRRWVAVAVVVIVLAAALLTARWAYSHASDRPATASESAEIVGPTWTLAAYVDPEGFGLGSSSFGPATAVFKADGSFNFFDTCNTGGGLYKLDRKRLITSATGTFTLDLCVAPVQTAMQLLRDRTADWSVSDDTLVVSTAQSRLTFRQ